MLLLLDRAVPYGSAAGNVLYSYVTDVRGALLLKTLLGSAFITLAYWLSDKLVERMCVVIVLGWIVLGCLFQIYTRSLYPQDLAQILRHDGCTSFYTAALRTTPRELLSNFEAIAPSLPGHARTNMPGKTLMFDLAVGLSDDANSTGRILIGFSALAGLAVFAVAERWLRSRRAALLALVLYMVLPSKLNFLPHPNTVTPLFVFLSLWLLLVYLDRSKVWILLAFGLSLYALLIFEPLPFVLGLLFLGAIAKGLAEGQISWRSLWKFVLYPLAGFLAGHIAMKLTYGFDAFSAFKYMMDDALDFNARENRRYGVWVVQNIVEFAIGLGVVAAMMLALAWFETFADGWQTARHESVGAAIRAAFAAPVTNMLICFFATLLIVNLLGVNRGEVTRLWIFMAVAVQIALAGFTSERFGATTGPLLVGTCAMQAMVSTASIGFMIC